MKKPNILVESIIVGFYSLLTSVIILQFFNYSMLLNAFIIGFFKHFMSGIFGLQQYYCSRYIKCDSFILKNLILESIGEGILFVILYSILSSFRNNVFVIFFIIGVVLHLSFEELGIHSSFCKSHCKKTKNDF